MRKKIIYFLVVPLFISVGVASLLHFAITKYFYLQAKEHIDNILLSNRGFHHYIQKVLHPAFFDAMKKGYVANNFYDPQVLSSSYIVRVMHGLYNEEREGKGLKPLYYKMAANNPRNPVNRADEREAKLIRLFNDNRNIREHEEIVKVDGRKYLYYAIPFLANEQRCLRCHGRPEDAPPGLRQRYPEDGGFHEKVGEIRAIESMRVPIGQEGYLALILTGSASSGLFAILVLFFFNTGLRQRIKEKTENLELEILERKKTGETISKLLHQNDLILNSAGDGIYGVDMNGDITFINSSATKMLGWKLEEVIGKNSHSLWHDKRHNDTSYPLDECRIMSALKQGVSCSIYDETLWRKDGTQFPVEIASNPIAEGGRIIGAVVTFKDISERKKAEEEREKLESQLTQSQKMEAIGLLAGGIAHDFNNMLTAIMGYGNLLSRKLEKDSTLKPFVDQILYAAEKSASLTRQLLTFSRKQIIAPKDISLNELIKGMEKLLLRIIGEDIELKTRLTDKPLNVMADPGQVEQALMNLCTNARDAMPHGGMLSICTDRIELNSDYVKASGLEKSGTYALISVTDTGTGMDENVRQKIFDPFFTTKEMGKGTGLGLSIVYGVARQHGGNITVYSEPGKGTTFKIYLPLVESADGKAGAVDVVAPKGGTETILVVEDSEEVRMLTTHILQEAGYKVITAVDGDDAMNKFAQNKDTISLVLTDVIMPRKSGKEISIEIKGMRPDIKILFMSGYTADIIIKRGILDGEVDFISKPIAPNALLGRVRDILDR